jgi:hypothetical protein
MTALSDVHQEKVVSDMVSTAKELQSDEVTHTCKNHQ